ncbi:NtaA/DmoA family FMN-dependent monooxygenase [Marinitenerispora sediminis]|uniref:NtaA/DmoA family FMN-dependent monooxygenase n=1 Tax=Marinitenerispora sediminis TaxID=1931232 RepID=UPI000DF1B566|nr:NtaA/DmoA family FMN-dependent monooxygenase [Marinitenerispora sediminis]RCV47673.1 F420-dependent methylene-tetrahydromethanopterin reductase [Marinitenerispora sediminis]RCV48126.1 F420-dependent methylene-tetrahydromethanopterin reductase [Marinitenerispora sediminis]
MSTAPKQIRLAAHFPGVNSTTVWSDPAAGSQIDFGSFRHLAQTAERGRFDFFFLAEGLRLREHQGRIFDLDVVGRPDTLTVLSALAAVTTHLGLAGTLSSTFNEPYELARQLASLDHLSAGRAAWNVVTSSDAFTGENFRRGGYLDHADRYERAAAFVRTARELWDSPLDGAADPDGAIGAFRHRDRFFDIEGEFSVPRSPQGHPVVIQAGDSEQGREFAAAAADIIFSRHGGLEEGRAFYADVKARLARHGRSPDELLIMPGVTFVLGATAEEAAERARRIRYQQVSGPGAINFLEQVWGRDLSGYDPDGPLPDIDPDPDNASITRGRVRHTADPLALARRWRAIAEAGKLSIRDLIVEVTARQTFVGTPAQVAAALHEHVRTDACDGFILVPHLTPGGLDDFVEKVVPLLQERGVLRTEYTGGTLRENLGLPAVPRRAGAERVA